MKAISPMIAVVLLIAFTIGIGTLISIFATSLTTTSTGLTSNQSEALTKCAGAWININSVTNTSVLYQNPNPQTITGATLIFTSGNTASGDSSMTAGESTSTSISAGMIPGTGTANTSLTIRALCQTLVTVEGKCSVGQDCWDI